MVKDNDKKNTTTATHGGSAATAARFHFLLCFFVVANMVIATFTLFMIFYPKVLAKAAAKFPFFFLTLEEAVALGDTETVKQKLQTMSPGNGPGQVLEVNETTGRNALQSACRGGHLEIVKLILEKVPLGEKRQRTWDLKVTKNTHEPIKDSEEYLRVPDPVDECDEETNWNALHWAAWRGDLDIVKLLMDHNADFLLEGGGSLEDDEHPEYKGTMFTAFHLASCEGHLDVVKEFIQRSIAAQKKQQLEMDADGKEGEEKEGVDSIFRDPSVSLLDGEFVIYNEFLPSPLQFAASRGQTDVVELLLAVRQNKSSPWAVENSFLNGDRLVGKDIDRSSGDSGISEFSPTRFPSPLYLACAKGHALTARLLLQQGANLDCMDYDTKFTPVQAAMLHGHTDVMHELLWHAAAKGGSTTGNTGNRKSRNLISSGGNHINFPLLEEDMVEVVRTLLLEPPSAEWEEKMIVDWVKDTPWEQDQKLIRRHSARVLAEKVLLNKNKNTNKKQQAKKTAMSLLDINAIHPSGLPNNYFDHFGQRTVLHAAAEGGNPENVQMLLKHGASPKATDIGGNQPLHVACKRGNVEAIKELIPALLKLEGRDVDNNNNNNNVTTLEKKDQKKTVPPHSPSPCHRSLSSQNNQNVTPLQEAARSRISSDHFTRATLPPDRCVVEEEGKRRVELVEFLLDSGVCVNQSVCLDIREGNLARYLPWGFGRPVVRSSQSTDADEWHDAQESGTTLAILELLIDKGELEIEPRDHSLDGAIRMARRFGRADLAEKIQQRVEQCPKRKPEVKFVVGT